MYPYNIYPFSSHMSHILWHTNHTPWHVTYYMPWGTPYIYNPQGASFYYGPFVPLSSR